MLHLLQTAVNLRLPLQECVRKWHTISLALRESPRRRDPQMARIETLPLS